MDAMKTDMPLFAPRPMTAQLGLDAVMKNAPIGILFTWQSLLVQANEQCAAIFGYTVEELVGQQAVVLYPNEKDYASLGVIASGPLRAGELFQTDYEMQRKDGCRVWCRLRGRAINPKHVVDGTLWTIEDITEERLITQGFGEPNS
jgi:PAS domain S-box-containing protein